MQLETYKEGIKLYNSQNTSKQMLKDNFVIRLREYQKIWKAISESDMQTPEQHFIVQGVRGSGKTTLLNRLAVEIADDESLSKWLIPIVFKEEEYGISSLFGLWERVAEELEETDESLFGELLTRMESLEETDPKKALNLLDFYLKKTEKKVTLFIDNIVELFENFAPLENDILREVLITNNNIRIIGGSAKSLESFFDYKAPFYQFFKVITLKGLKQKDTIALLTKLSEHSGKEEQTKLNVLLEREPEKIESIRRLTGGIPRTLVILFNILMEGPKGKTYTLLEETIDKTTPLYKHRMDDLSKQHKPIVNAIALNWDAMSAKEIAEKTRLSSKQVSAQLGQLEKQWIIEKIPTNTKNNLYAIKERFFNIWYLMRYGRRKDRKRVIWLTQFFELWCTGDELKDRVIRFIEGLNKSAHPQASVIFANAMLNSNLLDNTVKAKLHSQMVEYFKQIGKDALKLELINIDSQNELKNTRTDNIFEVRESEATYYTSYDDMAVILNIFDKSDLDEFFDNIKQTKDGYRVIAWCCFVLSIRKEYARDYLAKFTENQQDIYNIIVAVEVLLWNNEFVEASNLMHGLLLNYSDKFKGCEPDFIDLFILFIAKGQYNLVDQWLKEYQLVDRLKPLYYALMSLMRDKYPNEILRMGSELQETVDEILAKIEDWREKYK